MEPHVRIDSKDFRGWLSLAKMAQALRGGAARKTTLHAEILKIFFSQVHVESNGRQSRDLTKHSLITAGGEKTVLVTFRLPFTTVNI